MFLLFVKKGGGAMETSVPSWDDTMSNNEFSNDNWILSAFP